MSIWPRWSLEGEPAALAKYVLPDDVAALVHLPGPPASSRIAQTRAVYDALADAGTTYSHEAPSDEPDRQVIREPGEVLWSPRHATCLDLALVMAGACLHAGLHPLVFILDPPEAGRAAHALLGVWIGDPHPGGPQMPQEAVWDTAPEGWLDLVQQDVNRPPRPLLLLDPIGIAHPLPTSPIRGARAPFAEAVRAGAEYAAGWDWRLSVDIGRSWRQQDTHTPAGRPKDQPLRPPYVELDPQVHRPLEVLKAEHEVVPFQARDELTVLTHFCRTVAAGQHTGVALIHGIGGAGKTRLALELAERMATREGWYTGYLREGSEGRDWLGAVVSPTLIVLDYAEARAADARDLLAILKRRVERGAVPAVVVMTARSAAGQWLTTLRKAWQRDGHLCREHQPPLELPSEHPDGSAIFRRAVEAFREEPDTVDLSAAERAALEEWTTLDYILLAFLAARSPGRLPETRAKLYEEVLEHERGYWAQTYQKVTGSTGDAPLDVLSRAVACLTLRAPVTRAQSIATLRAVEELADDAKWREAIRTTLTTCLQPGPDQPLVLRPDPIADYLTLHELDADPELLNRALDGLAPESLLDALRQLNRAAAANPDAAADMVARWISGEPERWRPILQVAAEQRGVALAALDELVGSSPALTWLDQLSNAIPLSALGLPHLGLHADMQRLAAQLSATDPEPSDLAGLLLRLSNRQSSTGDHEAALASVTKAVDHYRALAQDDPTCHLHNLATAISDLSVQQGKTGNHAAALDSAAEAVRICRTLAQTNPSLIPQLARALSYLGAHQSRSGQHEAALKSTAEAVDLYRPLARAEPASHLNNLAVAISNLSVEQLQAGYHQAALDSITESVKICRTLVQTDFATHLHTLAQSLNNLSLVQRNIGDRSGALSSIAEAVYHFDVLAQINSAAYLPNLALSLNNLGVLQSDMGDPDAALASVTEAVDLRRSLAQTNPDAYLPDLAESLNNLSLQQTATYDPDGALATITEAVGYYRTLTSTNPAAYVPGLATSLMNLSLRQSDTGDLDAALATITEAVDLRRSLAQTNPDAYLPDLAESLNNLSLQQTATCDPDAALATITEAVGYYRTLTGSSPAHLPGLARSLDTLAGCKWMAGDYAAAMVSIVEAVTLRRTLAEHSPAVHLPDLADSLTELGNQHSRLGNHEEALASVTEAVEIYRARAASGQASHLRGLAKSLNRLGAQQGEMGHPDGALTAATEALKILRTLAETSPATHGSDLADSLDNLGAQQSRLENNEEALASFTEAVTIRRTLAETSRANHLSGLARSLNNVSLRQGDAGDQEAAMASINEAVTIRRELARTSPDAYLPDLAQSLNNLFIQQRKGGEQDKALSSIKEAVKIRRTLAETSRAVHLPDLADSLTNLAAQLSELGYHEQALASITEAVGHYRSLVEASPSAFLHRLTMSLYSFSHVQSDTSIASAVWKDAISTLQAHIFAQAEVRAHYAAFLAEHGRASHAVEQLILASGVTTTDDTKSLRRVRQLIQGIVKNYTLEDPELPDWSTHPLPSNSLQILNQWMQVSEWPSVEAFLRRNSHQLQQSDFHRDLQIAASLNPGNQALERLAALLAEVDTKGLGSVMEAGRGDYDRRLLLQTWIDTATWEESKAFLHENHTLLGKPEVRELLAIRNVPVARRHLAILQLSDALPLEQVYEIVTDRDAATEHAFYAIDHADVPHLRRILHASPGLLTGLTGALFAAVTAMADGNPDQARQLAQDIAEHGTGIQRRACAIRLRALAEHDRGLTLAEELANLIDPDDNS
ncbi:tetratricopeptide repeat protein [Streptomyces mirabilis]|uniref:tetratricopeptide repeat protein n=1 Tax=Streptomyces mirabilis TaxID=68239 RepID=UPI0033B9FF2B